MASYPLIIPETNVTFNFRLPSRVPLKGKVFFDGKPVGSTNAVSSLSPKLVGNMFYNVKFEKTLKRHLYPFKGGYGQLRDPTAFALYLLVAFDITGLVSLSLHSTAKKGTYHT